MGVDTEGFLLEMTRAPESTSSRYSAFGWTYLQGQCISPSHDAIVDMTSGGRGDIATYSGGIDLLATWTWIDLAAGHSSTNSTFEFGLLDCYVLRKSTNQWVPLWTGREFADAALWGASGGPYAFISPTAAPAYFTRSGSTMKINLDRLNTSAIEAWQQGFRLASDRNNALLRDAASIHVRIPVRVAMSNPAGSDDRANARLRIVQGFDWDNSTHYNYRGHGSVWAGFARADTQSRNDAIAQGDYRKSYPGYSLEGCNGSWKVVPFNPADPNRWYYAAVTTLHPCNVTAGIYGPWATALGIGDFTVSSTWAQPPFAITHATFRANPPPDMGTTVTPGPDPEPEPAPVPTPGVPAALSWVSNDPTGLSWATLTNTAPVITSTSLPAAVVGTAYTATLMATGNPAPTWTVTTGTLPAGLSLAASTGIISGTPTTAALSATVEFTATNSAGTDAASLLLSVSGAFSITTAELPNAIVGTAYTATVAAVGQVPILWDSTSMPAGLTIERTTGVITGTPTAERIGSSTVTAQNGAGDTLSKVLPFNVLLPPTITTTTLADAVDGQSISVPLMATGTGPFVWRVAVGSSLPPGLSIVDARLAGVPVAGTYAFTIEVVTAAGTDSQALTLEVNPLTTSSAWVRIPRNAEVWVRVPRDES